MYYTTLHVAQVYLDTVALQIWQGGRFCGGISESRILMEVKLTKIARHELSKTL